MQLTVGDIIQNTEFDVNANVIIREYDNDEDVFKGDPRNCPADLLVLPVDYITIDPPGYLVVEYNPQEKEQEDMWIHVDEFIYVCKSCKIAGGAGHSKYCPHCGRKMY